MQKPGIFHSLWLWGSLLTYWRLKPAFKGKNLAFLPLPCAAKAMPLHCWQHREVVWAVGRRKQGGLRRPRRTAITTFRAFFFFFPFHCLFHHISNRRVAHMAHFDSVFLKNPSTLESVIRGACLMQSCLWHWLAGFSMSSSSGCVPSFWSPVVLQENICLEGHNKGKSRNLNFHPHYSCVNVYIAADKRSSNKGWQFCLQSSEKTRGGLKVIRRDLDSLTWASIF